jgi:hypothetical protein
LVLALLHPKIERWATYVFALACIHGDLELARAALARCSTAITTHPKADPFGPEPSREEVFGIPQATFKRIPPASVFGLLRCVQRTMHVAPRDAPEEWRRLAKTFTVRFVHVDRRSPSRTCSC